MASTRTPAVALLVAVGALALGGCAPTPPAGGTSTANDREAVRAITTAESHAGGRAFELDSDDDEWEVHVAVGDREVSVHLSSDGGEVRSSNDDADLDAEDRSALEAATTTLADAVRIAAGQASGRAVDEAHLKRESGSLATWIVELAGDASVRISAADGSVG